MKGNKKSELKNEALESVAGGFGKNWTEDARKELKEICKNSNVIINDLMIEGLAEEYTVDEFYNSPFAAAYKIKRPSK